MLHEYYNSTKTHYPGLHGFCDLNCIRLILEANQVSHSSLYIDASMDMQINLDTEIDDYNNELLKHTKQRNVIPEYADKITKHYYPDNATPSKLFDENIKTLKNNELIAVGVDNYHLPYMKNDHYHTMHAWHTIVLCGVEDNDELLYVIDWAAPWIYQGTVPKDDLLLARHSSNPFSPTDIFSGLPIQDYWIEVDPKGWNKTPSALLAITLGLSLEKYFNPPPNETKGINCISYLYAYFSETGANLGEIDKEQFATFHRKIYIALLRHKLFTQYLEIAKEYINDDKIDSLIGEMRKINNTWEVVLMLVLKVSMTGKKSICGKICNNLKTLKSGERKLGESLINLSSTLA